MPPSSAEHVEKFLTRLAEVDGRVRSVCTTHPGALDQARALDAETADGRSRGPLHGQPVLVKDNVDTCDLPTTAGSLALADAPPPSVDAPIVARLRAAGMVVLGKTNLSEWANIRDESSTSGWSGYGGLTRNPYGLNRSAGGSSSGSGAALAAGLASYAVGTETDGSISCPAAFNGVVGIKPTVGLLPGAGIVPISRSQDTAGPMARTVADATALLAVLADRPYDATVRPLAGLRVGVPRADYWGYSPHADGPAERALSLLAAAGATIVDGCDVVIPEEAGPDELLVMLAELVTGLSGYLATRSGDVPRTLADVVAFNRAHADVELAHFGQSLFERALEGPADGSEEYTAARARCLAASRTDGIDRVLREHSLDALMTPSYAPASPIDLINPEFFPGACTTAAAMAGYPLLTVPSELAAGLPVAVTFWGGPGSEQTLITLAAAYEAARDASTGPLPPPTFPGFV